MLKLDTPVSDPQNELTLVFTNSDDSSETKEIALKGKIYL